MRPDGPSPESPRPAQPRNRPASERREVFIGALLVVATLLTMTTLAPAWSDGLVDDDDPLWLGPTAVRRLLQDPAARSFGLTFALGVIAILGAHEAGHWLACRRHGIAASIPRFLPAPLGLGTFGAFIRVRSQIPSRTSLFDVGVSGPIAGFVVLVPILAIGIAKSSPLLGAPADSMAWLLPGRTLGQDLLVTWLRPDLDPARVLLHPLALAGWVGMLVTCLNLLPIGQLDGGHILYSLSPRLHRIAAYGTLLALVAGGFLAWPGWWLWALIALVLKLRHPPLERQGPALGRARLAIALFALAIFVLSFSPSPIRMLAGS